MKITNEFTVQIPIDEAWKVFTDLEGIAPCMPGAQLTGVEGEVYKGKVKIKVGPVISDFSGTAQFTSKDDAAYTAVIDAKGRDARSAGNASATVSAALTAVDATSTRVNVDTDLKISGKLAQFGSGMIKEVSSKLLAQFVANLEKKLATDTTAPAAVVPAAAPAAVVPAAAEVASTEVAAPAADAVAAPAADAVAAPAAAEASVETPVASAAAVETVPVTAAPVGIPAADGSLAKDESASLVVEPDPSAGEVTAAAGRTEVAEGTPDPVAPLRTPDADLSDAPAVVAASSTAVTTAPVATPADAPATAPATASADAPATAPTAASADAPATAPTAAPAAATTPVAVTSGAGAAPAVAPVATAERKIESVEAEPLDLLEVAGGSIYKRLIPVAIGAVVVVGAVIVWFVARG